MTQVQFQEPGDGEPRTVHVETDEGRVSLGTEIGGKYYGTKLSPAAARRVSSALLLAADFTDGGTSIEK